MTPSQVTYLTFGIVLLLAVIFDLGLLSKKGVPVSIKKALLQTSFWVMLAIIFFGFLWYENGQKTALEYLSAYLMEWSLSIDNIFVFILIFTFFGVKEKYFARVLMIGILMAIILRILFITVGIALVARFHWLLYIFGAILVYTGITMFASKKEEEVNLDDNKVYKFLKRLLPLTTEDGGGKFSTLCAPPASLISAYGRPFADRRFRVPGDPAHRPQGARSGGLLRSSPLPAGRQSRHREIRS